MFNHVYVTLLALPHFDSQLTLFDSNYCLLRNATVMAETVGETKDINTRLR